MQDAVANVAFAVQSRVSLLVIPGCFAMWAGISCECAVSDITAGQSRTLNKGTCFDP